MLVIKHIETYRNEDGLIKSRNHYQSEGAKYYLGNTPYEAVGHPGKASLGKTFFVNRAGKSIPKWLRKTKEDRRTFQLNRIEARKSKKA